MILLRFKSFQNQNVFFTSHGSVQATIPPTVQNFAIYRREARSLFKGSAETRVSTIYKNLRKRASEQSKVDVALNCRLNIDYLLLNNNPQRIGRDSIGCSRKR